MKTEDQIIAGIEELASQLVELKKELNNSQENPASNISQEAFKQIENIVKGTFHQTKLVSDELKKLSENQKTLLAKETNYGNEVTHNYVEINNWRNWLFGFVSYFIATAIFITILLIHIVETKETLDSASANDIKYRFLKIYNEPLSNFKSIAKTSTDLVYHIDSYYESKPEQLRQYVEQKEAQIKTASEAAEIAKLKEAEAKSAREKANILLQNIK